MRINLTSVLVDDQAKALRFYTEVLGFVKKNEIPLGRALAGSPSCRPRSPTAPSSSLEPDEHPAARPFKQALVEDGIPFTSFAVDDVAAEYERLVGARRALHAAADRHGPGDDRRLRRHLRQPHPDRGRELLNRHVRDRSAQQVQVTSHGQPSSARSTDASRSRRRLSARLSELAMEDVDAIRAAFEELIGKPVDPTFSLIPPFYADYGLGITIGHKVFINQGCLFMGHGAIDIGDEVMIAPRVNLITTGHPMDPETRRSGVTCEPITVGRNVWIGATATVLQGVTIGEDAVVGAGAVVTRDVPARTFVAGVPARVIRDL